MNDNLTLLTSCRLSDKNYMYFMLQLLKQIPRADRKLRRVTPSGSKTGSNSDSSVCYSDSVNSNEKSSTKSVSNRREENHEIVVHVAKLICEYIFRVSNRNLNFYLIQ